MDEYDSIKEEINKHYNRTKKGIISRELSNKMNVDIKLIHKRLRKMRKLSNPNRIDSRKEITKRLIEAEGKQSYNLNQRVWVYYPKDKLKMRLIKKKRYNSNSYMNKCKYCGKLCWCKKNGECGECKTKNKSLGISRWRRNKSRWEK